MVWPLVIQFMFRSSANLFIFVGFPFIRGLTPADAEYNFLMKAKDLDYYGIELFQAQVRNHKCRSCDIMWDTQDPNGMELMVGITHVGVVVFHHKRKVNTYEWWGMLAFTIGGVFNSGIVFYYSGQKYTRWRTRGDVLRCTLLKNRLVYVHTHARAHTHTLCIQYIYIYILYPSTVS